MSTVMSPVMGTTLGVGLIGAGWTARSTARAWRGGCQAPGWS